MSHPATRHAAAEGVARRLAVGSVQSTHDDTPLASQPAPRRAHQPIIHLETFGYIAACGLDGVRLTIELAEVTCRDCLHVARLV